MDKRIVFIIKEDGCCSIKDISIYETNITIMDLAREYGYDLASPTDQARIYEWLNVSKRNECLFDFEIASKLVNKISCPHLITKAFLDKFCEKFPHVRGIFDYIKQFTNPMVLFDAI